MPSDDSNETMLIERIAKLEEAVGYNRDLIVSMSEKLDKFIEEIHNNQIDVISQYGGLDVRIAKLEQRLETESRNDYAWYTKLGLFVTFITALVSYIFKLIGR